MPVQRAFLRAKLHRAQVTQVDLHYEGSITIAEDLLAAADIAEFERVLVANVTNGARFETYTIAGARGSGVIGVNGAGAHLARVGDVVIIMAFALTTDQRAPTPRVVLLDAHNQPVAPPSSAATP